MIRRITWTDVASAVAVRAPRPLAVPCSQRAAVALVLREMRDEVELLFVRRAEHADDPWSGHIAFPGGRTEPSDRDLLATAVRETAEETGLDLAGDGQLLGTLDEMQAVRGSGPVDLSIAPLVFRLRTHKVLALGDEVVSAHWMRLAALVAASARSTVEVSIEGIRHQRPCLRVDGQVIWGLTYRMFEELAERLSAIGAPAPGEPEAA